MKTGIFLRASVCALFLSSAASFGQSPNAKVTVHLDPQRTEIHWTLKTTVHTVHGTFQLKGGEMTFDPATGAAQGELLVDVTTGQSGDRKRDGKMQSEVLESVKYPTAFFHPIKVNGPLTPGTSQNVTVDGTFNVHGQDHPLSLPLALKWEGKNATAKTHFVVPYVDWGMKNESTMLIHVEKQVDVDVTAYGSMDTK